MGDLIKAGKIRHYGICNETPFGLSSFLHHSQQNGLPKPCTVQNVYNLLDRNDFDCGMIEAVSPLNSLGGVGLLAASPLAGGALTGKYVDISISDREKSKFRMRKYVGFMYRYISPSSEEAVKAYNEIAKDYELPLSLIALCFVTSRPFTTSTVIGVSNRDQLQENVLSLNIRMQDELSSAIDAVYRKHMDPTKVECEIVNPNELQEDMNIIPWGSQAQDVDPELESMIDKRMAQWDE